MSSTPSPQDRPSTTGWAPGPGAPGPFGAPAQPTPQDATTSPWTAAPGPAPASFPPAVPAPVPPPTHPFPSAPGAPAASGPGDSGSESTRWTVMSDIAQRGDWVVPERVSHVVVMGQVVVDLRAARLSAPVTTVEIRGLMGEAKIIVPDTVRVECEGSAVMGEFRAKDSGTPAPPPVGAPTVRVVGVMALGEVTVYRTDAAPGAGEYKIDGMAGVRARRRERRERRRLGRG